MEISASLVMQLRDKTGVSMMACKKALVEANGDIDKAVEILRKSGEAKVAAKSERITNEGKVGVKVQGQKIAVVKVLCETDFVARSDDFVALLNKLLDITLAKGAEAAKTEGEDLIKEAVLKLGEKISVSDVKTAEAKTWGYYVHSTGKVAAVVGLESGTEDQAKEVAMHVTATNPKYLSPADVAQAEVDKEVDIMKAQLKNEGKPEAIWEKILTGKVQKFREENALLSQPFVKDPSTTIEKYLAGGKIVYFERFSI